jgi:hypothetical protein
MSEVAKSFTEVLQPASAEVAAPEVAADAIASRVRPSFDQYIFVIMTCILGLLSVLLVMNLRVQRENYQNGLGAALNSSPPDHSAALTYAQASDAAVIKLSALFLGFLLVFTGTLYVLRAASSQFKLQGTAMKTMWVLQSSSPGLVVVTLGVLLVAISLLAKNGVSYNFELTPGSDTAAPSDGIKAGAAAPITNVQPLQMVNP